MDSSTILRSEMQEHEETGYELRQNDSEEVYLSVRPHEAVLRG